MKITLNFRDSLGEGLDLLVNDFWTSKSMYYARFTPYQLRRIRWFLKGVELSIHPLYVTMGKKNFYNVRQLNDDTLSWR